MQRPERPFEYGPIARGTYHALLALMLVVPIAYPGYTAHYFWLLVFLGLGLRPVLEVTGLWRLFDRLESAFSPSFHRRSDPHPEDPETDARAARQSRIRH